MKHKNTNREYAFLMVEYETPDFIKDIQDKIKKDELYIEEGSDDYGMEKESHVTLVPCLNNDIDLNELKKYLKDISEYDILLTDVSKFECEKYDVLKCSVKSNALNETNKEILKHFDTHSEFKEYNPHLTIAYMQHGMADKYLRKILDRLVHIKPKNFHFSCVKHGEDYDIRFD